MKPNIQIPEALKSRAVLLGRGEWLAELPRLVQACAQLWHLTLQPPFEPGSVAWVAPVTTRDGTEAVLKINFPEPDNELEPDALAHWAGQGAVTLLQSDPARRALLIEGCRPGRQLWQVEDDAEAAQIWAGTTSKLWRAAPSAHGFHLLEDAATQWGSQIPVDFSSLREPDDLRMIQEAVESIPALAATQGELVVLHQDLHGGNMLQSERGWLVIDPQPLVGEREFDAASLLRDRRSLLIGPDGASIVHQRLNVLGEAGLDRRRMRLWGIIHALAWGTEAGAILQRHLHAARLIWRTRV